MKLPTALRIEGSPDGHLSFYIFCCSVAMSLVGMMLWLYGVNTIRLVMLQLSQIGYLTSFIVAFFVERRYQLLSPIGWSALCFYAFFLIYSWSVGWINHGFYPKYIPNLLWDLGFFSIGLSTLSWVGVTQKQVKVYIITHISLFLIYMLLSYRYMDFLLAFTSARGKTFGSMSEELGSFTVVYQVHQIFYSMVLPALGLAITFIKEKRYIILESIGLMLMMALGLFYQKRNVFLEIIIFSLIMVFLPSLKITRREISVKVIGVIALLVFFGLYLGNELIHSGVDLVLDRILATKNSSKPNDRIVETLHYFTVFDSPSYIFGRGLASTVPDTPGGNNLHIGYSNFLLKGGIPMLFSITSLLLVSVLAGFYKFLLTGIRLQLWLPLAYLFGTYVYLSSWGWFPSILGLPLALFSFDIVSQFKTTPKESAAINESTEEPFKDRT